MEIIIGHLFICGSSSSTTYWISIFHNPNSFILASSPTSFPTAIVAYIDATGRIYFRQRSNSLHLFAKTFLMAKWRNGAFYVVINSRSYCCKYILVIVSFLFANLFAGWIAQVQALLDLKHG